MNPGKRALIRFVNLSYKWLPILFGCHCRRDRSFSIRGIRFPICARCTGQLAGIFLCLVSCPFYLPKLYVLFLLMIPMVIDGGIQWKTAYESTNLRRLITGLMFGYASLRLMLWSYAAAFRLGIEIGKRFF